MKEEFYGYSILERTNRLCVYTELGPPDLCNIQKISVLSKKSTEIGTYTYFTGVDTSSSASVAAHLLNLATLMCSKPQIWFGELKSWRIPELTHCSYNAFSKVDMRVTVHIPGNFTVSVINSNGNMIDENLSSEQIETFWLETFISSMIRCFIEPDDQKLNKFGDLVEIRRINPFYVDKKSKNLLNLFMHGFIVLFDKGIKLGCAYNRVHATEVSNYMVDAFFRCVELTQCYDLALESLAKIESKHPNVIVLISKILLMNDQEIKALNCILEGIKNNPCNTDLILLQASFCMEKERYDLALELALEAVKTSPTNFDSWSALISVYIKLCDYENALLTLNSCPINTYKEIYHHKRLIPIRDGLEELHLPSPTDVLLNEVSNLQGNEIGQEQRLLDPQLYSMPASNLRSCFALAYDLLTEIVKVIGWERLLAHRANVFVMEEEYIKSLKGHSESKEYSELNSKKKSSSSNVSKIPNSEKTSLTVTPKAFLKEKKFDDKNFQNKFENKRLCDRWLDNLFILLYEDLKAYTMWQAEYLHFKAQNIEYKKSTLEWEILGSLAKRLKHHDEAKIAFNNAIKGRFSAKSENEILLYNVKEKKMLIELNSSSTTSNLKHQHFIKTINNLDEKILQSVIKLLTWNHRWYCSFNILLIIVISELVSKEGIVKILSLVKALYLKHSDVSPNQNVGIIEMMDDLFNFLKLYDIEGSNN